MSRYNTYKLNSILKLWPNRTVAVSSWLKERGVYAQLADRYQKSGWIESIGHGAFIHAGDQVDWMGGLYALQEELGLPIHVGARTALQLHGEAHFLSMGEGHPVFLFSHKRFLPKWFKQYDWKTPIHHIYANCFLFKEEVGLTSKDVHSYSIKLSTREMAMFEVLYLIGKHESYQNSALLMEGLNNLRPQLVQELLEKTSSIKVKRLFMHLAERFNHPWLRYVDVSKVNFGKGKRVIEEGGEFDNKYNISVPKVSL